VNITELPFDSDNYSTAHPVLSPDEKTMYFVSDMPGTIGLSDLFKVKINEDGTFGTP
jgi:Tol biopolymer transport system component